MEEINLKNLFIYIIERIKIVIILTVAFLLIGAVYSFINKPKYVSESSITIAGDKAKTLVTNYSPLVKNNTIIKNVIDSLNLKISIEELKENIVVTPSNDTINITISYPNYNLANDINSKLDEEYINFIAETYLTEELVVSSKPTITSSNIYKEYAKKIIVFTIVGFVLGIIYVFIKFYFDNSLKSEDDVKALKLDIYGVIPKDNKDSYRNIIDSITTKSIDVNSKVILLTSINESADLSETIYELANEYTKFGKKVLVIDTDLKNNKQAELFSAKAKVGYTELINSKSDKVDNYITKTKNSKIDIIANGYDLNNEVEILSSNKNEIIINELKNKYDIILIDTPPVLGTNGTIILSKYTDINLLLVANESTKMNDIKEVSEQYEKEELKLNGIIVNKVNKKFNGYSKHYFNNYFNK